MGRPKTCPIYNQFKGMNVLALGKNKVIAQAAIADVPIEENLAREWLLTNTRGGYSASTIVGCNTRRYHGLLVGTPNPPANRMVALSTCLETLIIDGEEFSFSTFEFSDRFAPDGFVFSK